MTTPMASPGAYPDWIAVDWGTTHLRVWLMRSDGSTLARLTSDAGMGGLARNGYEPALLALLGAHLPPNRATPVICCGMAGSRQGWAEAPYVSVPCTPPGAAQSVPVTTRDPRLAVRILPGIKQDRPADVMRGEETQIKGFLRANPQFDGVICLPGTHTKWAHVSANEIVSFSTFMTGELFALLSRQSVLRHSVATEGWDAGEFEAAIGDAMARPEAIASALFALRARSLIGDLAPVAARSRLSGLLIGIELAAARPYWLGRQVAIVGAEALSRVYGAALTAQGLSPVLADGEAMTLAGLAAAYENLEEGTP